MKKKLFSCFLVLAMMFMFSSQIFAATVSSSSTGKVLSELSPSSLTEQEDLILDYVESFGRWDEWYTYYASSLQENYRAFTSNADTIKNNTGIMVINSAELLYIEKVDKSVAPYYPELESFYTNGNYECYLIGVDIDVKENTKYYFDGINYKLVVVVKEDGIWKIGAQCGAPIELLLGINGEVSANAAIADYCERAGISSRINSTRGIGWGFITGDVNDPPAYIYVGDGGSGVNENGVWGPTFSGTVYTVDFEDYIYNSTSNEIYSTYDADAIKACAISIKMFAWWCHLGTYRETYGCDLLGNFDQAYDNDETTYPTSISNAIDEVVDYYILSSNGKFFTTNCNNFTSYNSQGSGHMVQSGAQSLAVNSNYTWQQIIHYYFDNSTYNHPDCGIVQIGTHTW